MTVGNLLAIPQTNIKRLLGYSSIAHAGYVLVGIAAMSVAGVAVLGQESVIYYIIAFAVSDLAAFIAIIAITNQIKSDNIADFAGMARRSPALAGALTLALLSLTGFPPTAGFLAKFYIFNSGVQANMLWLVVVAVLNTIYPIIIFALSKSCGSLRHQIHYLHLLQYPLEQRWHYHRQEYSHSA